MPPEEIVITGVGVVSPIGIGREAVWESFLAGRSGVGRLESFDASGLTVRIAGEVRDFDPKQYVKPRKALKLMGRDSQLGVAASVLAVEDGAVGAGSVDPERMGVVLGADTSCDNVRESQDSYRPAITDGRFDIGRWITEGVPSLFPLRFLKVLPNMVASHVSIAHDAQGPNNTIHQGAVSPLLAVAEACRVIQRGAADVMIAGGASSMMEPFDWAGHCVSGRLSTRGGDPTKVARPFDAGRDGEVYGEGAATVILERRAHAEARGAKILARVLGWSSACERYNGKPIRGEGLKQAIRRALEHARLDAGQVGHVNAHGAGTVLDDAVEARAIRAVLPDVPVTALKSYFGNLSAAGGAVEMLASVLGLVEGRVPATLNYERPDPECPVPVVHGPPLEGARGAAVVLNATPIGQAAVIVLGPTS